MAFLELQGERGVRRFKIAADRVVIGRHPSCGIVIEEQAVSRQHAAVTLVDGCPHVEDLQSRNGTTLNGRPLTGRQPLEHGDEIDICGRKLVFRATSASAARSSAAARIDSTAFVDLDAAGGQPR